MMKMGQGNWTVPNILTLGRLLLVPVFVMAYLKGRVDMAALFFLAAGLTDGLDGFLARMLDQRTKIGAILDPLADKTLLDTAYICMSHGGLIPSWLTILVVSRDLFIVGGMGVLSFYGVRFEEHIHPMIVSKANTLGQMLLILAVLGASALAIDLAVPIAALIPVVGFLTVLSGVQYLLKGVSLLPE